MAKYVHEVLKKKGLKCLYVLIPYGVFYVDAIECRWCLDVN